MKHALARALAWALAHDRSSYVVAMAPSGADQPCSTRLARKALRFPWTWWRRR
jgi:hypothetical protein